MALTRPPLHVALTRALPRCHSASPSFSLPAPAPLSHSSFLQDGPKLQIKLTTRAQETSRRPRPLPLAAAGEQQLQQGREAREDGLNFAFLEGKASVRKRAMALAQSGPRAPRPKRIILVRHGESEGNVDESSYGRIPDSRIALTNKGWEQACERGRKIRELVESDGADDWKVYFYVSPYKRTIQTLRGVGLAFERSRIAGVREEPRIREQDFGNFQCRERMRVEKQVRMRFGRFFYRFPDGESAADVYDRVTGFRETLRADVEIGRFQRKEFTSPHMNLVLVSHGLTLRVFLMRWFKWTVTQFEGLYNFDNASMMVMELGQGGRYSLRMHHSREELSRFGMTEEMIDDQEWQIHAKPGELNAEWVTSGPSFFDHFDENDELLEEYVCEGLSEGSIPPHVPEEIVAMQGGSPN